MKKLIALLFALGLVFAFAACGGEEAQSAAVSEAVVSEAAPVEEAPAEEPAPVEESVVSVVEEPAEPQVQEVTIGDYHVVYENAILYKPFESDMNPAVVVFYFSFTNNSTEAYMPDTRIFCPAVQGEETLGGVVFTGDKCPVESLNYEELECPAGETVRCCVMYNFTEGAGNVEVTFMDIAHTIEDKLVVSVDPASLELVTEPLGIAE